MAESAISISSIDKFYDSFQALHSVSLEVPKGQTLVICGPSGSGKSTLIRCMNGLEQHEAGRIRVLGHEVGDNVEELTAVRKQVGMVFQSFNLFPHLTVLENCVLPQIRAIGRSREESIVIAQQELSKMHVVEHKGKYPDQISGGQKQRVAIARALCHRPEIMLFDEPTSALDPEMISEVLDVMQELAREEMTMVCVTHEMGFARSVADSVLFMASGKTVEQASPEQIFTTPSHELTRKFMDTVLQ